MLTIHLLLNAHQVRRAAAAIDALQKRLSATAPELLSEDDDYEDSVVVGIAPTLNLSKVVGGGSGDTTAARDAATAEASALSTIALDADGKTAVGATARAVIDRRCSSESFRWMFRLYRLRCSVLSGRNVLIGNEDTAEMSVLRAHQFYNGIDYQMAAKELSKPFASAPATIR